MRILADENIPLMTISELRRQGHDVRDKVVAVSHYVREANK